ncbi:MAG: GTPase Era [Metamycoplasmataceae bacterium]
METKICFISIIGRPNVGKSTLLNNILNYNLAIISPKAQTTRDQIIGVYTHENIQLIFTDTPGIHKSQDEFGEVLNQKSYNSITENDLILFLQPANENISKGDNLIIEKIKNIKKPKIALLTKIDLIENPEIINEKTEYFKSNNFNEVLSCTNKNPNSITSLLNELSKYTYKSNFFYSDEDITDKSLTFIAKEIIREAAISFLREEIPHSIVIEISDFKEDDEKILIEAKIICQKESQKGIIIGKNGQMIKNIGTRARKNLELQFDKKIVLNNKVFVDKNWKKDNIKIKKYGY